MEQYIKYEKNEVLMQLFCYGPIWDGNLVSKMDRDILVEDGLVDRWNGWNYLNRLGVKIGYEAGLRTKHWHDQTWYKKTALNK